jgi:hypothetical protein
MLMVFFSCPLHLMLNHNAKAVASQHHRLPPSIKNDFALKTAFLENGAVAEQNHSVTAPSSFSLLSISSCITA